MMPNSVMAEEVIVGQFAAGRRSRRASAPSGARRSAYLGPYRASWGAGDVMAAPPSIGSASRYAGHRVMSEIDPAALEQLRGLTTDTGGDLIVELIDVFADSARHLLADLTRTLGSGEADVEWHVKWRS